MLEILPRLEKEEDILAIVEGLSLACREHLVWELTGEERLMLTYKDLPGNRRVAPAALWRCYQHLSRARVYLEQNANRRLVLEVTLLNLYRELTSRSL
ncbi:hypothetical protein [Thermanaeromonas toyohensis]|uniref:hypothetical protein n=1 Tax=Thermanaeromonas toyohensis TaxID=161154 RepID=UPI0009FF0822|nr:hypothetical protein [Thermanaeromonas toyohensis]